jgi:hypothetical protein
MKNLASKANALDSSEDDAYKEFKAQEFMDDGSNIDLLVKINKNDVKINHFILIDLK